MNVITLIEMVEVQNANLRSTQAIVVRYLYRRKAHGVAAPHVSASRVVMIGDMNISIFS